MAELLTRTSAIDDLPLSAWRWRPGEALADRGTVVIAHGMGEHALRYDALARALAGAGLTVLAPDHRGHGASPGPSGLGDFGTGGWEALVADLALWIRLAHARDEDRPVILFGHSMGSLAAQQYCCEHEETLDGLILSGSTCFDLLPIPEGEAAGLEAFNARFEPARTPFDWLSRDAQQVDRYIDDPLCGFDVAEAGLVGMRAAAARIADPAVLAGLRDDLPVLVVSGADDPLHGEGALIETLLQRWRAAGARRVEVKLYPGGRHELLNETNSEEVTNDLVQWIHQTLRLP